MILDKADRKIEKSKSHRIPISEIEDDELTVILRSWGTGVSKIEQIFIKNGAIKVVEMNGNIYRELVYIKDEEFKPPMRKGDIVERFAEDLKEGKVKGLPKMDVVKTKVRLNEEEKK